MFIFINKNNEEESENCFRDTLCMKKKKKKKKQIHSLMDVIF